MVWKTGEWLNAGDIVHTVIKQLHHLRGKEPALTHLIADGNEPACFFGKSIDVLRRRKKSAFAQSFFDRGTISFKVLNNHRIHIAQHFIFTPLVCPVDRIVQTVEHEVQKIGNDRFTALCFNDLDNFIVGIRVKLDENFANYTHLWFRVFTQRQGFKIIHHISNVLFILHE
ncbi:hypothetical protein D3C81_1490520 [compost metagenome]